MKTLHLLLVPMVIFTLGTLSITPASYAKLPSLADEARVDPPAPIALKALAEEENTDSVEAARRLVLQRRGEY
jgi:hypothetical protein